MVTVNFTDEQAELLMHMFGLIHAEGIGVDIWLAPGGVQDVNENGDVDCFLDADDFGVFAEAYEALSQAVPPIKVSVTSLSVSGGARLLGYAEFSTDALALQYIQGQFASWMQAGKAAAAEYGGTWDLDDHQHDNMDLHDLLADKTLTANGGEEMFIAALDADTVKRLVAADHKLAESEQS